MRLAIGGPTRDQGPVSFAVDLAQLYAYTRERGPWPTVTVGFLTSTYIHVGRELFLEAALLQGATHVLWLDTDMGFPMELAVMLARHDVQIVGCNYVTRDGSRRWTARRGGVPVPTLPTSTGLETVDGMGFGAVLMRTDILLGLPRPWFFHDRNARGGDIGEDLTFCRILTAAGVPIVIDHDVSKAISHVGQQHYRTADYPVDLPVERADRPHAISGGADANARSHAGAWVHAGVGHANGQGEAKA